MAPEEGPSGTSRRASRPTASRRAGKRVGGGDLIQQLNEMVAELIKENRKLKRQVVKLTERGSKVASSTVDRTLRTIQRRVRSLMDATGASSRIQLGWAAYENGWLRRP